MQDYGFTAEAALYVEFLTHSFEGEAAIPAAWLSDSKVLGRIKAQRFEGEACTFCKDVAQKPSSGVNHARTGHPDVIPVCNTCAQRVGRLLMRNKLRGILSQIRPFPEPRLCRMCAQTSAFGVSFTESREGTGDTTHTGYRNSSEWVCASCFVLYRAFRARTGFAVGGFRVWHDTAGAYHEQWPRQYGWLATPFWSYEPAQIALDVMMETMHKKNPLLTMAAGRDPNWVVVNYVPKGGKIPILVAYPRETEEFMPRLEFVLKAATDVVRESCAKRLAKAKHPERPTAAELKNARAGAWYDVMEFLVAPVDALLPACSDVAKGFAIRVLAQIAEARVFERSDSDDEADESE